MLQRNTYSLKTGTKTNIASGTGLYYISQPNSDSLSCLIVTDYDNTYIVGNKKNVEFTVNSSTLYATNNDEQAITITVRKLALNY